MAQIGLIFIEISLGLQEVALIHIAGNAFLRTYQLLVSPSIVSYKIREQFYNFVPQHKTTNVMGFVKGKVQADTFLIFTAHYAVK